MIRARHTPFFISFFSRYSKIGLKCHFHRILLTFGFTLISFLQPAAGNDCSSNTIYRGYISGDIEMWKKGMTELQEVYSKTAEPCLLFALTEARYGYIGYLLGLNMTRTRLNRLLKSFETDIERLAVFPEYRAETEAFRVALLGFRMGINPAKAMTLGPKALKQLEKAVADRQHKPCSMDRKG